MNLRKIFTMYTVGFLGVTVLLGLADSFRLFAQPEKIAQEAHIILDAFGPGSGHVFNLGHGISQFTPPEHVAALVNAVHEHSRKQRQI